MLSYYRNSFYRKIVELLYLALASDAPYYIVALLVALALYLLKRIFIPRWVRTGYVAYSDARLLSKWIRYIVTAILVSMLCVAIISTFIFNPTTAPKRTGQQFSITT